MAKLLDHVNKDGHLLSVKLTMTTDTEMKIFRSFIESEPATKKCRQCGEPINPNAVKDMRITIHSPLSSSPLGFPTGDPTFICPHCGREIVVDCMMDITPFTAITKWLTNLKRQAQAKAKGSIVNGRKK